MAQPCGPLISTLLSRVRDPHGMATTRAMVRSFLTRAQHVLNSRTKAVLVTETLNTEALRMIYPIQSALPLSARVETIRDSDGVDLDFEVNARNLANFKTSWFRDVGDGHVVYSLIGRDLLVLYPAVSENSTVTVLSTKLTSTLIVDDTQTEIPNSDLNTLLDVTELMLSIKSRRLARAQELVSSVITKLGLTKVKNE